jgi:PDZ domain/Aspartyl protease
MIRAVIFFVLILFSPLRAGAQAGFFLPPGMRQIDIPFEYSNNFIILTVTFNGVFPLKFIFDTCAEHTILSKREISDLMQVPYAQEFRVTGADLSTELIAYLARQIRFDAGKMTAPREDILVLKEDYFRFEEYAGVQVHGIMSANVFSKYIFKINYERQLITLYERQHFSPRELEGYIALPVEIFRNKIYLNTKLQMVPDSTVEVKLLVDTGAGLPLLLFSDTHPLLHPPGNAIPSNIGMGLGGFLEGFTGRVYKLDIGAVDQRNVISYFQTLDSIRNKDYLNKRNGLLGNGILSRFYIIYDYQNSKIWLKPTKEYKQAFVFDRSGISLIASGAHFNKYNVQNVMRNSPAGEADIRQGDELIRVGRTPAGFYSMSDILRILQKKPGKKIHLVIRRDGKKIKKTIILRDLI